MLPKPNMFFVFVNKTKNGIYNKNISGIEIIKSDGKKKVNIQR